jgi:two-component system, response regulator
MKERVILLVEDNPDDVKLTQRALKHNNITNRLVVARDGLQALNYLEGVGDTNNDSPEWELPAVVLLDLKLPKVDGLEVLRRLRGNDRLKLLPVVILTSSNEEQDIIRSYHLGANSYIRKPVDFEQFTHSVRELGLYWLLLNQPPPTPAPHYATQ